MQLDLQAVLLPRKLPIALVRCSDRLASVGLARATTTPGACKRNAAAKGTSTCKRMHIHVYAYFMKLQSLPCYCATLRQAARAATALYESALADSGLHLTQYTALQALKLAPNLTTTDLADLIGMDQTTATRTLALIKKRGLIASRRGQDRRERRWNLTSLGESVFGKAHPKWQSAQAAFEQRLGRSEALAFKRASFQAASRLVVK